MKTYLTAFILIAFVAYWGWIFVSRAVKNQHLKNSKEIKAVVFNDRNYMGNSPVSHDYSYSYRFEVKGNVYTGNFKNSKLKPGDTILIKYATGHPDINEPVE